MILVSSDRRKLVLHYTKPAASPSPLITDFNYDVVSTQPDMLVLSGPIFAARPNPHPASISIRFLDPDTYIATSSDRPFQTTGAIERCK